MFKTLTTFFLLSPLALLAAPIQWTVASGGNDHWYELSTTSLTWNAARADALSRTNLGQAGYLATVTSASERAFILALATAANQAWLGGSDAAAEGVWRWMDGPEAGQIFWNTGTTVTYANWNAGEPSNTGATGEHYLKFQGAGWNDLNATASTRFIIEYDNVPGDPGVPTPEPSSFLLMAGALMALPVFRRRAKLG